MSLDRVINWQPSTVDTKEVCVPGCWPLRYPTVVNPFVDVPWSASVMGFFLGSLIHHSWAQHHFNYGLLAALSSAPLHKAWALTSPASWVCATWHLTPQRHLPAHRSFAESRSVTYTFFSFLGQMFGCGTRGQRGTEHGGAVTALHHLHPACPPTRQPAGLFTLDLTAQWEPRFASWIWPTAMQRCPAAFLLSFWSLDPARTGINGTVRSRIWRVIGSGTTDCRRPCFFFSCRISTCHGTNERPGLYREIGSADGQPPPSVNLLRRTIGRLRPALSRLANQEVLAFSIHKCQPAGRDLLFLSCWIWNHHKCRVQ